MPANGLALPEGDAARTDRRVCVSGQRRRAQESFIHDPQVQVLLATDAAGEGVNLQRAHLMVNYDFAELIERTEAPR